ncbi:MAG: DUF3244 domain-containing protein [Ignavibacteria bacterium]|nr:DUF3244 domain-containing protein [Ignavibacteria bacterium]
MKVNYKFWLSLLTLVSFSFGCSSLFGPKENRLYFCEKYDSKKGEIGESSKFTTGNLTVMVDLRPTKTKVGVSDVNINITDKASGEAVETLPFTVQPSMDYIYFNDVNFKKAGKYRVSCLKKDGTVIVTGEVEIVDK